MSSFAYGQSSSLRILRDAEMETFLYRSVRTLYGLAGLSRDHVRIFVLDDRRFNAFVNGSGMMFVNTGLFFSLESPDELMGVLAHETAHVALGHPLQTHLEAEDAGRRALLGSVLGVLGGIASGEAGLAIGASSLSTELSRQQLLGELRVKESSSDVMALDLLHRLGYDVRVMLKVFGKMERLERLSLSDENYFRTHPLSEDRRLRAEREIGRLRAQRVLTEAPDDRVAYERMRVKVMAYTLPLEESLRKFRDPQTWEARYGFAITLLRYGRFSEPLRLLKEVSEAWSAYGYVDEVIAEAYMSRGEVLEAAHWMGRALEKEGEVPLLWLGYGEILLEIRGREDEAEKWLWRALEKEGWLLGGWRRLMTLYSRRGEKGKLQLAHAEFLYRQGYHDRARELAEDAWERLSEEPKLRARAQDILVYLSF
jgi:predicted Zn-dependent protease